MCGRYGLIATPDELTARYAGRPVLGEFQGSRDVRPTQIEPVITMDQPGTIQPMHWGFYLMIQGKPVLVLNSRDDKLDSFTYRFALQERRCLVPAQEFYEWQVVDNTNPKKPVKQQMTLKPTDAEIVSLAGLYFDFNHPKLGTPMRGYTILTTTPNDVVRPIHDRMPVMLPRELEERWLDPATPLPLVKELVASYPASAMICSPFTA